MSLKLNKKPQVKKSKAVKQTSSLKAQTFKIDPTREGQMLELSLTEIETKLKPLWDALPYIQKAEDLYPEAGYLRKLREDIDEEDFYDTPDMEQNIENDWAEDVVNGSAAEASEDFLQYAWRMWEEDFVITRDEKADRIAEVLKLWKPPYSMLTLDPDDEDLRPWFDLIREECPGLQSVKQKRANPQPDIIFSVNSSGDINYEVNLGYLDQLLINRSVDSSDCKIPWVKKDIPLGVLNNLRQARRDALSLMSEFLIENQKQFLCSENLEKAAIRLRPKMQKDFVEFSLQKKLRKDKSWGSRVIANKMVKIPFSNQLFPLAFFFDMALPKLICLQKAFDIHIIQGQNKPLSSLDQVKILRALSFKDINEQQVRKTLWLDLQQLYTPNLWERLKIVGTAGKPKEGEHLPKNDLKKLVQKIAKIYSLSINEKIINDL